MPAPASPTPRPSTLSTVVTWLLALLCLAAGTVWLVRSRPYPPPEPTPQAAPTAYAELRPGVVTSMDSPALIYSPGWTVTATGADPSEPADAWQQPAGVVTFCYTGRDLALLLAPGDYWGYLYVTVDGAPANLLPRLPGNADSAGNLAGYRTLYAPERLPGDAAPQWIPVHRASGETTEDAACHDVRIEVWRSWGQVPLRGLAVDALPPASFPVWPAILLIALGLGLVWIAWPRAAWAGVDRAAPRQGLRGLVSPFFLPGLSLRARLMLAGATLLAIIGGIALHFWPLTVIGVAVLAWAAVPLPALWTAALLLALPFYYAFNLPLLPNRDLGLIDAGLLVGLAVLAAHRLLFPGEPAPQSEASKRITGKRLLAWLLAGIVVWALAAVFAAQHFSLALREWRTVFLAAALFALLLTGSLAWAQDRRAARRLLVAAWLAGGVIVALVGLWQYASGQMLIGAEGVWRVRAFYGSPNNLALYLERTLAVTLALALYAPAPRLRWSMAGLALIQGAALLLTFSKGALLLGLPALLVVLALGGLLLWPHGGGRNPALWWLAAAVGLVLLALLPFVGTERFQRLLDLSRGTGFLRLQLWRSAWQMALDHPLLGVGPDNFLYAYRSQYLLPAAWQEPNLNHPHNWPLDWWTRLGLPGLLLALGWFTTGCVLLWRTARAAATTDRGLAALALGLLAACAAALAHGLIDASYALPDLMLVWVFVLFVLAGETEGAPDAQR